MDGVSLIGASIMALCHTVLVTLLYKRIIRLACTISARVR